MQKIMKIFEFFIRLLGITLRFIHRSQVKKSQNSPKRYKNLHLFKIYLENIIFLKIN